MTIITIANKLPETFFEYLAGFLACLTSFTTGTAYAWSSPVGVKLASNNSDETPLHQNYGTESDEFAWISSIMIVGILISSLFASFLADYIGRKWTLLTSAIFFVICYIMFIFGSNVWIIYIGRVIQGLGAGFVLTVSPLYLGEIATNEVRGRIISMFAISLSAGVLYGYAVGASASYLILQIACLILPICFVASFIFMPDTPYYFARKGQRQKAIDSLRFLRRKDIKDLEEEYKMIETTVEESSKRSGSYATIFTVKSNLKAFCICLGLIAFQMFSGHQAITFNVQIIFEKAHVNMDSGLATIIVTLAQLIATGLSPLLVDRFGRKFLLLLSSIFMCLGQVALGVFFYMHETGSDTSSILWLPIVSLAVFLVFSSIGFLSIPFTIIGEIFPQDIKFKASAIIAMSGAVIAFLVTRFHPVLVQVGVYLAIWLYSIFCGAAFFFVLFCVFETKGLSFQQIQDILSK